MELNKVCMAAIDNSVNHYLHLSKSEDGDLELSASDGVFSYCADFKTIEEYLDYCEENADNWLHSSFRNYDDWSMEDRKTIAERWDDAKNLTEGKYEYYFNLGDIKDIFSQGVKALAQNMGITNYTLIVE